ncbi:MAG: rhomboid family intramembrane serine protease [Bacteroidota bacterium]|nr:rhomboid family intramembrane serine protease [Candidatus Kapabacteria bacterium]MDW8218961.1 rhomboid family intramembrane serine protease [Bacteroidota bacterium]
MKLDYNSPVVLTFALVSAGVMIASNFTGGTLGQMFFATYPHSSWTDIMTYFRLFSHIFGHASWEHLFGNLSVILLIGPLLEEKYSSQSMLVMIITTAVVTAVLNNLLFTTGLMGASGIVFMMILLSSFANLRQGYIPLTFVIVLVLYLGREVYNSLKADNVSQFAHILGGICGSIFGFMQKDLGTIRGSTSYPPSTDPSIKQHMLP